MDELLTHAQEAQRRAYAPYSEYSVGAALRIDNETIYTGCNIENKNIKNSFHAEEVALVEAIKNGEYEFERLAVTAPPCGKCRQSYSEFCDEDFEITFINDEGEVIETSLGELLPDQMPSK